MLNIYVRHFFCFFPFPYLKFEIVSCINQCISLTINSQKNVGRSAKESEVGCCTKTMSPIHGLVIFVPLNNINECLINWKAQHTKLNSEVISHFFIGKHSCLTNIKKNYGGSKIGILLLMSKTILFTSCTCSKNISWALCLVNKRI